MGCYTCLPAIGYGVSPDRGRLSSEALPGSAPFALPASTHWNDRVAMPDLPEDALDHMASFRPVREMRSMAADAKSRGANGALHKLADVYSSVCNAARNVHDLASFQHVLGTGNAADAADTPTVTGLRQDLRAMALTVLIRRIPELPANDRQPAAVAFRAAARALGTAHRTHELMAIERIARCEFASVAAGKGENLRLVTACFGMSDPALVAALERHTARRPLIRDAVQRGANVQALAERHGFITTHGVRELERMAVLGPAGDAVRGGRHPRAVARQYGLTAVNTLIDLELIAIDSLPPGGEWNNLDPRQVAADIGVALPGPAAMLTERSTYSTNSR